MVEPSSINRTSTSRFWRETSSSSCRNKGSRELQSLKTGMMIRKGMFSDVSFICPQFTPSKLFKPDSSNGNTQLSRILRVSRKPRYPCLRNLDPTLKDRLCLFPLEIKGQIMPGMILQLFRDQF